MKKFLPFLLVAFGFLLAGDPLFAQVPAGLTRFGTTGAYPPQVGNCVSIMAMNSSGQVLTDVGTPCTTTALITPYTNGTVAYTAIMALPPVAANAPPTHGECTLIWEENNTAGAPTFAVQLSAAVADLWTLATFSGGTFVAPTYTVITTTAQTAVTGSLATTTANAPYRVTLSFLLDTAAVPSTLTVYALNNSASWILSVMPGSYCQWVP
jgi:hypothetical protein